MFLSRDELMAEISTASFALPSNPEELEFALNFRRKTAMMENNAHNLAQLLLAYYGKGYAQRIETDL